MKDPNLSIKVKLNPSSHPSSNPSTGPNVSSNNRPNSGVFTPTIPRAALPQQSDILWGRVIIAVITVVAILAGVVWGGLRLWATPAPELDASSSQLDAIKPIATQILVVEDSKTATIVIPAEVKGDDMVKREVQAAQIDPVPAPVVAAVTETPVVEKTVIEKAVVEKAVVEKAIVPISVVEKPVVEATKTTLKPPSPPPKAAPKANIQELAPSTSLAKISVHSKNITHAALSNAIDQRQPVGALPEVVRMGANDLLTLYFFTTYRNLKGQTLYHDWYRNGQRIARVKSRPSTQDVEVYSSKYIDPLMLGDWEVKAVGHSGKVLAEGRFEVQP